MNALRITRSDKNHCVLASSGLLKFYQLVVIATALLVLDFHLKIELGADAVLLEKTGFLFKDLFLKLGGGYWLRSLFFLVPLAVLIAAAAAFGYSRRYEADKEMKRITLDHSLFFMPVMAKSIPFEQIKAIHYWRHRDSPLFALLLEDQAGKRTWLERKGSREILGPFAVKLQEMLQVPINQKTFL